MKTDELARRPLRTIDARALIGLLATLEGELAARAEVDEIPEWARHLTRRLEKDGLLAERAGNRELRQALNDLNHRLRFALGEYSDPPEPTPLV